MTPPGGIHEKTLPSGRVFCWQMPLQIQTSAIAIRLALPPAAVVLVLRLFSR